MNESGLPDIDIGRWATCEREALHGPDREKYARVHVGALVAQAVRHELTGEEGAGNGELDLPCTVDEKTPRVADVPRQAALLSGCRLGERISRQRRRRRRRAVASGAGSQGRPRSVVRRAR